MGISLIHSCASLISLSLLTPLACRVDYISKSTTRYSPQTSSRCTSFSQELSCGWAIAAILVGCSSAEHDRGVRPFPQLVSCSTPTAVGCTSYSLSVTFTSIDDEAFGYLTLLPAFDSCRKPDQPLCKQHSSRSHPCGGISTFLKLTSSVSPYLTARYDGLVYQSHHEIGSVSSFPRTRLCCSR